MVSPSSELAAVVNRYLLALQRGDVETVRSLTSRSDSMLLLGSDPREWYQGSQASDLIAVQMEGLPAFRYEVHRLEAFEEGSVGWAGLDLTSRLETGVDVPLRITAVLHLEEGVWRLVLWHASVPQPDSPEVIGTELSATMQTLLDSMDSQAEAAALRARLRTTTVTIVFTDIEDSTARTEEIGDEAWSRLITTHFQELEDIARAHDGVLVKTLGDGAMLAFGSARAGIQAALEASARAQNGATPLPIRIGVHTGEAISTETDYFGQTVNRAARIAAASDAGQVLSSDVTRILATDIAGFAFDPAISLQLKGIPGSVTVHPVRAVS